MHDMKNLKKILNLKGGNTDLVKRYIRRFEYLFMISIFLYIIALFIEGYTNQDFGNFSAMLIMMQGVWETIKNDKKVFITILFLLFFSVKIIKKPVKGTLTVIVTLLFLSLISEEQLFDFMTITERFLGNLFNYFVQQPDVLMILILALFVTLLKFPNIRMVLLKAIVHIMELVFISLILYYVSSYVNVFYLFLDYINLFNNKIVYIKKISIHIGIIYLFIVFFLKYYSIISSLIFHYKYKKENNNKEEVDNKDLPIIGVCIPAFNEELTIVDTVLSVLASEYSNTKLDIIVVSDGSTDETIVKMRQYFQMELEDCLKDEFNVIEHKSIKAIYHSSIFKNLYLIDKENGGKYDCLNTALECFNVRVKYMTVIDADTYLEKNALKKLASKLNENPKAIALTGLILPYDSKKETKWKKYLTKWQIFDYLSSFHISRAGLCLTDSMIIVSGAFGLFNRLELIKIEGYKKSLGEDILLTLELQEKSKGKILYVPEALAYTQVPDNMDSIRKQRMRWFKGLTEALMKYKNIWMYKPNMFISYFEFFVIEWLTPIVAPFGIVLILGDINILKSKLILILFTFTLLTNLLQSLAAFCIENTYRKVPLSLLNYLWIQLIMSPFMILYQNDALLEYYKKNWDKVKRY